MARRACSTSVRKPSSRTRASSPAKRRKAGSSGKPVLHTEVRIVRPDGSDAAVGELGDTPEDRAMLQLYASTADIGRSIIAPPGMAPERLAVLRAAFDASMKDADFLAEVDRAKADFYPAKGAEVVRAMADAVDIPVTVKMRRGVRPGDVDPAEVARRFEDAGAAMMRVYQQVMERFPALAGPRSVWTVGKMSLGSSLSVGAGIPSAVTVKVLKPLSRNVWPLALVNEGAVALAEDHKRVHRPSDVVFFFRLIKKTFLSVTR